MVAQIWALVSGLWPPSASLAAQQWILALILLLDAFLFVRVSLTIEPPGPPLPQQPLNDPRLTQALYALLPFCEKLPSTERALFLPGLSLFAGWLAVACVLNLASAVYVSGAPSLGPDSPSSSLSAAFLLAAGAIALGCTAALDGNPFFAAATSWGFLGCAVANFKTTDSRGGTGPVQAHPALAWLALALAASELGLCGILVARGTALKWLPLSSRVDVGSETASLLGSRASGGEVAAVAERGSVAKKSG